MKRAKRPKPHRSIYMMRGRPSMGGRIIKIETVPLMPLSPADLEVIASGFAPVRWIDIDALLLDYPPPIVDELEK